MHLLCSFVRFVKAKGIERRAAAGCPPALNCPVGSVSGSGQQFRRPVLLLKAGHGIYVQSTVNIHEVEHLAAGWLDSILMHVLM